MIPRFFLPSALALSLSLPASADVQYGVDTDPDQLRVMMGHHTMATNLELGRTTAVDYTVAAEHYHKAALMGYPLSQNRLGRLYEMGRGVPQDDVKAYAWYAIAASHGNENASADRDATSKRLSESEILEAKALMQQLEQQLP